MLAVGDYCPSIQLDATSRINDSPDRNLTIRRLDMDLPYHTCVDRASEAGCKLVEHLTLLHSKEGADIMVQEKTRRRGLAGGIGGCARPIFRTTSHDWVEHHLLSHTT
jgi:hypothetical protein